VCFLLPSAYPYQGLFRLGAVRLKPGYSAKVLSPAPEKQLGCGENMPEIRERVLAQPRKIRKPDINQSTG